MCRRLLVEKVKEEEEATHKLQADTISKKMASLKGISFSRMISARIRTLDGSPPLLKALIKAEHAMTSSWMPLVSISWNRTQAFSQFSVIQRPLKDLVPWVLHPTSVQECQRFNIQSYQQHYTHAAL